MLLCLDVFENISYFISTCKHRRRLSGGGALGLEPLQKSYTGGLAPADVLQN